MKYRLFLQIQRGKSCSLFNKKNIKCEPLFRCCCFRMPWIRFSLVRICQSTHFIRVSWEQGFVLRFYYVYFYRFFWPNGLSMLFIVFLKEQLSVCGLGLLPPRFNERIIRFCIFPLIFISYNYLRCFKK